MWHGRSRNKISPLAELRITESFCHVDLMTADAPDAGTVGPAVRLLPSGARS